MTAQIADIPAVFDKIPLTATRTLSKRKRLSKVRGALQSAGCEGICNTWPRTWFWTVAGRLIGYSDHIAVGIEGNLSGRLDRHASCARNVFGSPWGKSQSTGAVNNERCGEGAIGITILRL